MEIEKLNNGYSLSQKVYTKKIIEKFGFKDAKMASTPMDLTCLHKKTDEEKSCDQVLFQRMVGSLLYLATCTRPDISTAVNQVLKYCSNPSELHFQGV
jgi:hypothetical protein